MDELHAWHAETLATETIEALKKHGFDAVFLKSPQEAIDFLSPKLLPGMKIGFGGSMTIKGLGIQKLAEKAGCIILDHNAPGLTADQKTDILRSQLTCDLFISGSNAVTMDGEIVNVDANGNRVAALTFGPKEIVVVMGINKIVTSLDEAFERIETIAAPINNKRLNRPNPCTKTGVCMDCNGPMRSCRIYQILKRCPALSKFTVVIVGEQMGF